MVGGFDLNLLLTSGNSMIMVCTVMVVYGFMKLIWVAYKSGKTDMNELAFSKVMVEHKSKKK